MVPEVNLRHANVDIPIRPNWTDMEKEVHLASQLHEPLTLRLGSVFQRATHYVVDQAICNDEGSSDI